jgi:sugar O-acyltransferase (sialic acid O-acetyltransferase NeuD family)
MNLPVLIVGGGGHAKVLIEALRLCSITILGIIDADAAKIGIEVSGIRIIGDDKVTSGYKPETILLVNGIGSVRLPKIRTAVFEKFKATGFTFATIIHPSAVVASDVVLGEGAQIMAGVVIQPGCIIGADTIVNTRASIDHDCKIGDHVHLAPGVVLSGGVKVGTGVHIGTGTTVIQGVSIGENCLVGAGSVIVNDIPSDAEVMGVPAKKMNKNS